MNLCETATPQEPLPWPDGRRWRCTRAWLQAFELRRGFRGVGKRGLTVEGEHVRERRASRAANDKDAIRMKPEQLECLRDFVGSTPAR